MAHSHDLDFLSRKFETVELPKEKRYLLKYFKTPLQVAVLKYFYVFGEIKNFPDHSGFPCRLFWLEKLVERHNRLESAHKQAKTNMDMSLLAKIESGKYKLPPIEG